jgi:hypothetical protein
MLIALLLDPKASVRVATTANITLSGLQTIDGITVVDADRVLVKNQSTGAQNGIYTAASGVWTRATDFDGTPANEVTSGAYCFVEQGTVGASTGWVLSTPNPITVGTTALTFVQFSAAASSSPSLSFIASGAITAGSTVFSSGTNRVSSQFNGTAPIFGTAITATSNTTKVMSLVHLNTTAFVLFYYDNTLTALYGVVGTYSGTTITLGTPVAVPSSTGANLSVHALIDYGNPTTKVLVSYINSSSEATAVVATISGTTISFGTRVVANSGALNTREGMVMLTQDTANNNFAILYRSSTGGGQLTARGFSVSGTTISYGTETLGNINSTALAPTDNLYPFTVRGGYYSQYGTSGTGTITKQQCSVATYRQFTDGAVHGKAFMINSGGSPTIVASNQTVLMSPEEYSSGLGIMKLEATSGRTVYGSNGVGDNDLYKTQPALFVVPEATYDSNAIRCISFGLYGSSTSFGSTNLHPYGGFSEVKMGGSSENTRFAIDIDSNNNAVIFGISSTSQLVYTLGVFNAASKQIDTSKPTVVSSSCSYPLIARQFNTSQPCGFGPSGNAARVIAYNNSSNRPEIRIFLPPSKNDVITPNTLKYVGIAQNTVTNGQTVGVTPKGSVNTNVSGLTLNAIYYVDWDGALTRDETLNKTVAGIATSTTSLLVG